MRQALLLITTILGFSGLAHAASDTAIAIQKANTCRECHGEDGFDLRGLGADEIASKIKGILAGNAKHKPDFGDLSDDEVAEVAKLLASDWEG